MPNIKSAKKRVSVIARRKKENRYVKSTMATMIKNFRSLVAVDAEKAEKLLSDIVSYINSAKTKGVIHKNNASRKVARLNLLLNKAKIKETPEVAVSENTKNIEEKPEVKASEKVEKPEKKVKAAETKVEEKQGKAEKTEKTESSEKTEMPKKAVKTEADSKMKKEKPLEEKPKKAAEKKPVVKK